MDKLVYSGSIAIALVLIIGSLWMPGSAIMWLASTSLVMNVARLVLVGLMTGLLLTDPPRRRAFRALLGAAAAMLAGWAVARALGGTVQVVDALLFMAAAISFGLAAIEAQPLPDEEVAMEPEMELDALVAAGRLESRTTRILFGLTVLLLPRRLALTLLAAEILRVSKRAAQNLLKRSVYDTNIVPSRPQLAALPP